MKLGIPLLTPVFLYKLGLKGVCISRTCFPDVMFIRMYVLLYSKEGDPLKVFSGILWLKITHQRKRE